MTKKEFEKLDGYLNAFRKVVDIQTEEVIKVPKSEVTFLLEIISAVRNNLTLSTLIEADEKALGQESTKNTTKH